MLSNYTIDQLEIEITSRTRSKVDHTDYLAEAINDIPTDTFVKSLCVRNEEKDTIYSGPSKITLNIKQGKVIPTLANIPLKGAKRTAVFQMIMHHSRILTNSKGYGNESPMLSSEQTIFDTYQVEWNNKRYTIGFIQKEDWHNNTVKAYTHANWMSVYKPKPDRVEADIKVFSHNINPIHTSCDYDDPVYVQEQIDSLADQLEYWQNIAKEL